MSSVRGSVVRLIAQVASAPDGPEALLSSVGLTHHANPADAARESVEAEAYYDFIERATRPGDDGLPYRYAGALHPDDFSVLGLALKTASTLRDSLRRLARYIAVLSDTLEYELLDAPDGSATLVLHRPGHRRGARLANECALAATTSVLRAAAGRRVTPTAVWFAHARPVSIAESHAFFGCPVRYAAGRNALDFDRTTLETPAKLADGGLSAFLLSQLEEHRGDQAERSVVSSVHTAVTDLLPDGVPRKAMIARRLGMSERTLHRRLAEHGETFQSILDRSRREAAEALLADAGHSLADVAFLTGFADQSAFQRAFKSWTGQTPRTYRTGRADQPREPVRATVPSSRRWGAPSTP